ncbi:hypothetical protein ACVW0P_002514 [Mucilaginibacter sp. UYNi724]
MANIGKAAAAFFTAAFPGNISQYRNHRSAFGLATDAKRFGRLLFKLVLVYWALKGTGNLDKYYNKTSELVNFTFIGYKHTTTLNYGKICIISPRRSKTW